VNRHYSRMDCATPYTIYAKQYLAACPAFDHVDKTAGGPADRCTLIQRRIGVLHQEKKFAQQSAGQLVDG